MKILSLECSAKAASVAITDNGKLLSEFYSNIGLTHSQTLLPMADSALKASGLELSDIDAFAISKGPGSFTGLRIGISAIKGLAIADNKPCVGVSTLEAIAEAAAHFKGIIVATMDARCRQFYSAIFSSDGASLKRIMEDSALSFEELLEEIQKAKEGKGEKVLVLGDGAEVFMKLLGEAPDILVADEKIRFQSARFVSKVAEREIEEGKAVSSCELLPLYLRLPQAERELKKKLEEQK